MSMSGRLRSLAGLTLLAAAGSAQGGAIYLTGHDVFLHSGQSGYDGVILDFLRGSTPASSYSLSVVGSGVGSARFTGGSGFTGLASGSAVTTGTAAGFGAVNYYQTGTGADWNTILAADALVLLSHTSCGGCDMSTAGSAEVNAHASDIASRFNAGMDIWANSGARLSSYYDFLPPGATSTGASISGSSGFTATADGTAIGITSSMINGFATHNRFTAFDPAFTVFETRGSEVISIGIKDALIGGGGIITPPPGGGGTPSVPEPGILALLGLGAFVLAWARRRQRR